ncbi:MAG: rod shape-determining protein MreD [Candidatus Binataceae bacterium]
MVALFAVATFVGLALETTIPRLLPMGALVPDLVLILVVDLGFRHHGALAPAMAFAMGYAVDSFSGTHLGLNAFMYTLIFLLAYEMSRHLMATGTFIGVTTVFLGVILKGYGDFAISSAWNVSGQMGTLLAPVLLQAMITALLAPWVFVLMARGKRTLGLPQRSLRE